MIAAAPLVSNARSMCLLGSDQTGRAALFTSGDESCLFFFSFFFSSYLGSFVVSYAITPLIYTSIYCISSAP